MGATSEADSELPVGYGLLSARMLAVLWSGSPADAKLVGQLRDLGIRIAAPAEAPVVAEVMTALAAPVGRTPSGDGPSNGLPWIWFVARTVPADDAGAAVARGAYDVIDAREPGAVA